MIVIDAKDKVVGRLASYVAKQLLKGETVYVLNAEQAIFTGKKELVFERYKQKYELKTDQRHKIKLSRRPDLFLKRVIVGMLPRKKTTGRDAAKRLKCFIGVPEQYKDKIENVNIKSKNDLKIKDFATVLDVCTYLGYHIKQRTR